MKTKTKNKGVGKMNERKTMRKFDVYNIQAVKVSEKAKEILARALVNKMLEFLANAKIKSTYELDAIDVLHQEYHFHEIEEIKRQIRENNENLRLNNSQYCRIVRDCITGFIKRIVLKRYNLVYEFKSGVGINGSIDSTWERVVEVKTLEEE